MTQSINFKSMGEDPYVMTSTGGRIRKSEADRKEAYNRYHYLKHRGELNNKEKAELAKLEKMFGDKKTLFESNKIQDSVFSGQIGKNSVFDLLKKAEANISNLPKQDE